jgi:hypothetical protein
MKRILLVALVLFACVANAQVAQLGPFSPTGNTVTITANISGSIPSPVQATSLSGTSRQYLIANVGSNAAYLSYSTTSAGATANCVVPTGTSTAVVPVLGSSMMTITTTQNSYFCAITSSSTSVIYITPGDGT